MLRNLFLFLAMCACITSRAQTVSIYVLKDDPINVKCFRIL
ncbi:MAG TPA: hypothetical protein VI112_01135 [Bacteroidia bacterium]